MKRRKVIINKPASAEDTEKIFGIGHKRSDEIKQMVSEALASSRRHILKEAGDDDQADPTADAAPPADPGVNADNSAPKPGAGSEGGASLDSQVDQYLAEYEGEAKSSKTEGRDFRMMTRRFLTEDLVFEDDAPPGVETGKLGLESLDVESFCNSVVRLIDNYDSLLEVRNTLYKRAKSFLTKTYAEDVLEAYDRLMRDEHDIEDGKTSMETADDKFQAPAADRAGDGGTGPGAGPGA